MPNIEKIYVLELLTIKAGENSSRDMGPPFKDHSVNFNHIEMLTKIRT